MAWTTPKTWSVGEVVTAANMNAHVRDNLAQLGANTKPSVRVSNSATQNVSTGASNSLNYDTEAWDYGGMHVTGSSSHRLKAATGGDGVYLVGANYTGVLGTPMVDKQIIVGLEHNSSDGGGTLFARHLITVPTAAIVPRVSISGLQPLTAGQYVCHTVFNGTTSTAVCAAQAAATPQNFWATWNSA